MCCCAGNKQALLSGFVDTEGQRLQLAVSQLGLVLDEDSVTTRLEIVRGFCNIEQEHHLLIVSKNQLDLNRHKRLHYSETNRGTTLAFIDLPSWDAEESWSMPVDVKKRVIGTAAKIAVGGPCAGDDGNKRRDKVMWLVEKFGGAGWWGNS